MFGWGSKPKPATSGGNFNGKGSVDTIVRAKGVNGKSRSGNPERAVPDFHMKAAQEYNRTANENDAAGNHSIAKLHRVFRDNALSRYVQLGGDSNKIKFDQPKPAAVAPSKTKGKKMREDTSDTLKTVYKVINELSVKKVNRYMDKAENDLSHRLLNDPKTDKEHKEWNRKQNNRTRGLNIGFDKLDKRLNYNWQAGKSTNSSPAKIKATEEVVSEQQKFIKKYGVFVPAPKKGAKILHTPIDTKPDKKVKKPVTEAKDPRKVHKDLNHHIDKFHDIYASGVGDQITDNWHMKEYKDHAKSIPSHLKHPLRKHINDAVSEYDGKAAARQISKCYEEVTTEAKENPFGIARATARAAAANRTTIKTNTGKNISVYTGKRKDATPADAGFKREKSQTDLAKLHRIFNNEPGKMAKGLQARPWGATWDKYHKGAADFHSKKAQGFAAAANQKGIGKLTKTRNIEKAEFHATKAQANRKEIPLAPERVKMFRDAVAKRKANQMKAKDD